MTEHKIYKIIFVCMILLSCVVLITVNPHVDRASDSIKPYLILDYICKGYFILDLVLQLVVYGLFQN